MARKMHVKTGDTVMIISGKDKGRTGKVLEVSPSEGKVIVEGCNLATKHCQGGGPPLRQQGHAGLPQMRQAHPGGPQDYGRRRQGAAVQTRFLR